MIVTCVTKWLLITVDYLLIISSVYDWLQWLVTCVMLCNYVHSCTIHIKVLTNYPINRLLPIIGIQLTGDEIFVGVQHYDSSCEQKFKLNILKT